jgi:tetratricopeptide (TPR) repeat protein
MNSEKQSGMKKHLMTLLVAIFIAMSTQAQTVESKFGVDSIQTLTHTSIYTQLVKQKRYAEALPDWRYVFVNAPAFQKSTYIHGVNIMRYMSKKNPKYIDTLMMVYDQRIKYFGNDRKYSPAWILGRKGKDCFKYKGKTTEGLKEAYTYISESISGLGNVSEAAVLSAAMNISVKLLKKGELSKEEVIANYEKYTAIVEKQMQVSPKHGKILTKVQGNIETLFFDSGVADCETLAKLLTPKFEAGIEDINELKSMISLLKRSECIDGDLYSQIAEKIYVLEPSADSAYDLAILFVKSEDYVKSEAYFKKAIAIATVSENKVSYLVKLATIKYSQKKYPQVKKYCKEALSINPKSGAAYILIGKAYANYSKQYSKDAYEQQTVFWVAVDKFLKARRVDPSVKEEASKLIKIYSQYFPLKKEAFFRNITPGKTVKVGGWINESTAARFNH